MKIKPTRIYLFLSLILFSGLLFSQDENYNSQVNKLLEEVNSLSIKEMEKRDSILHAAAKIAEVHCSDSLVSSIYVDIAKNYKNMSMHDSTVVYYNKALKSLPENQSQYYLKTKLYQSWSDLKNYLGQKDSTIYYLDLALLNARTVQDSGLIIGIMSDMARFNSNNNKIKDAITLLQSVKEYQIRHEDYDKLKYSYNQLGVCYFLIKEPEAARETFFEGLEIPSEDEGYMDMHIYNNLGRLYSVHFKMQDSAIYYYHKSAEVALRTNQIYSWLVAMLNLGNSYEALEQYEKAEEIYLQVLRSKHISNYIIVKTAVTINLGIIYYHINQYDQALFYIDEGLMMARDAQYLDFEINALKYKALLSGYFNNQQELEENFELLYQLVDSSYSLNQNREISELKVQYETEKAAQENENLKNENELNAEIIKRQKSALIQLILSLVVLVPLSVFLFLTIKKQHRTELQLKKAIVDLDHQKSLTELRNRELKKANQTKDRLFSVIAHDLKSPFSAIQSYLDILDDETFDFSEEHFKAIVGELRLNVLNTSQLLENLLEWSLSQRNGVSNNPENINLYEETQRVARILIPKIEQKQLTVEYLIDAKLTVYCDPQLYRNALLNLFNNAVKFTPREGSISIQAAKSKDFVRVCIMDNGVGIEEEILPDLFKIDSNYHTEGTEHEKGTGLGLAMCKEYVTVMGGKITVESTPGEGSVFCFTIPANTK
jgi:signal transduction histidine kinase